MKNIYDIRGRIEDLKRMIKKAADLGLMVLVNDHIQEINTLRWVSHDWNTQWQVLQSHEIASIIGIRKDSDVEVGGAKEVSGKIVKKEEGGGLK